MKFRGTGRGGGGKIEPPMAPMIDVVFQLLIFFLLTLRITAQEGDFNINMPLSAAPSTTQPDTPPIPPMNVRLVSNQDGQLVQLLLNDENLGTGPEAYEKLRSRILQTIGRPDNPLTEDMEVEIEADYNLNFEYAIKAVSACTGRLERTADGDVRLVRYIEKIKFTPPKKPAE